jgi:predicted amidohydrolase YtcJ
MKISQNRSNFAFTLLAVSALVSGSNGLPLCTQAALAKRTTEPDLIIYNAKIIADTSEIIAPSTAIAIKDEKVLALGNDARIKALTGPQTDLIDANGRLILPGFHDSHVHLAEGAVELTQLRLNDCKNRSEILASTKEYLSKHTKLKELIGNGLSLPALKDSQLSRLDLDAINSSIPIFIYAEDGHCAWLNTKALERIKTSELEKFSKTKEAEKLVDGTFSGVLREEGLSLLENTIVGPTRKEKIGRAHV